MKLSETPRCAECGGELPPGLPLGLCPHCALRAAASEDVDKNEPAPVVTHQPGDHIVVEPSDTLTPDQIFEQRWAQAVMKQAVERLREAYAARGKSALA